MKGIRVEEFECGEGEDLLAGILSARLEVKVKICKQLSHVCDAWLMRDGRVGEKINCISRKGKWIARC